MNIFDNMIPSAPSQRTAFDLNQRHIYSSKVGQDVPVLALDMLPKDYAEIDVLSLVRTLPLNTSAYARMKARFQFIFVPYQQLWHGWNQYFLQTQEKQSVGTSYNMDSAPRVAFNSIISQLTYNVFECYCINHDVGYSIPDEQKDDYLAEHYFIDEMGYYVHDNAVRLLDMLGYGSFEGYTAAIYKACEDLDHSQYTKDDMEIVIRNTEDDFKSKYAGKYVNLWRILAYQKAWQDYFMNKRVQPYDPECFNVDDKEVITFDNESFSKFFALHYHPWSYDMFSGLYTTPQDGDVSLVSGSGSFSLINTTPNTAQSSKNAMVNNQDSANANNSLYQSGVAHSDKWITSPNTGISVYDIKRAEYLQNWKENKLRAGNKLQNQARAQWNARFKYLSDEYSEYIGETILNVSIDEVVNTAENQGDISGKGIGTTNGHIKFSTDDAGILLCICSVTPQQEYNSLMMDKQNTCIEPWDYPSPFFDRLGFEAVYASQLNFLARDYEWIDYNFDAVLGYAPRYSAWKTAFDKVHGIFKSSGEVSKIEKIGSGQDEHYSFKLTQNGSLAPWAMPRTDIAVGDTMRGIGDVRNYYIAPDIADSIFGVVADSSQTTDHFLFNTNFVIRVVRQLSGLGLPNWQS